MTTSNSGGQIDFTMWLWRLIAYIIDIIIVGIVTGIILAIASIAIVFSGGFFGLAYLALTFVILGVLSLLYFIILDVYWGATIGKRVLGLQVQMENGGKVTIEKSFIRNISKFFWLFLFLDWLIAVATAGNDRRQKLTDRWAGTTVVQIKQPFQNVTATPSSSPPPTSPAPPPTPA